MQKVRTLSAVVALSSPLVIGIGAFAPRRQETRAQPNALDATTTRRQWLLTFSILAPEALVGPSPASGLVFFDPDRYGDKELKIAAVNKIRQNVRDVIVAQPELAPQFLQLAIQDGLTYNAKDQRGGPDGSIIAAILSKDSPADLAFLITASEVLVNLKAKLKKSTEISMADLVTFAGAEAIEVTGGSRVVVQLGKLDPQASFAAKSYPSFDSAGQIVDACAAFGLTQREVAITYCLEQLVPGARWLQDFFQWRPDVWKKTKWATSKPMSRLALELQVTFMARGWAGLTILSSRMS